MQLPHDVSSPHMLHAVVLLHACKCTPPPLCFWHLSYMPAMTLARLSCRYFHALILPLPQTRVCGC